MRQEKYIDEQGRVVAQNSVVDKVSLSRNEGVMKVRAQEGDLGLFDRERIRRSIRWGCEGHGSDVSIDLIEQESLKNTFDGMSSFELAESLILGASSLIEFDPSYGHVAARLLFKMLYREVVGKSVLFSDVDHQYSAAFVNNIRRGVSSEVFDARILEFDLEALSLAIVPERDHLFDYMGLRTLYERYFSKIDGVRIELPQSFWMRVAMGLAIDEKDKNKRAVEFYNLISLMRYVPSTPTLLHSALSRPQLSSCFLATVEDDLSKIFKSFGDNAQLSKWSGGVANDWTNIRATGAWIKGIKTESQGVIPYLKINSDVTASINRSGKRRAATVVYLETWHYDIEDFLDLRRNTGDERRRTHDLNTANWVPDLFMKRVEADAQWTLFSPEEVPDLHHTYGADFERRYEAYEHDAKTGKIKLYRTMKARELWRKMLSRLFETGHPWITFKDACNVRSPQNHAGVIHSSNLCTEVTLNTSEDEIAVCNLGSVNLGQHIVNGVLDKQMLANTVQIAMRMLDNVIDINFYPVKEAQVSNLRHRPVGLGLMGFQDALYKQSIAFDTQEACEFADESMELISYHAILGSSQLAKERGAYGSFKGSKWDRGIFPVDTIDMLEKERGMPVETDRNKRLDWAPVYDHVKQHGMRNSNTMAIAPTATISTISGCFPCIEPIYKNIYVKANMSGEFTVVNKYLVADLKKHGVWDKDMLDAIKFYDGNLQKIDRIPDEVKVLYKEAFEVDPLWLLKVTASRMKWIDQSQSHNVFMQGVSGKLLDTIYRKAWKLGLKTTYYLRTLGASQIEKSTLDAKKFGFTQKRDYSVDGGAKSSYGSGQVNGNGVPATDVSACSIDDTECESCQ